MNNKYLITAGAPLLRAGLTITTEVSEKYVVPATRMLLTLVRSLNDEVSDAEKLRVALKDTEEQLKKEIATPRPVSENYKQAVAAAKPKPTTVRIQPRSKHVPFETKVVPLATSMEETNPDMPMTERYHREVERRKACNRARFNPTDSDNF